MIEDKPRMQKSRAGQAVPEETLALYTAAKGFLIAEWIGALVMVYSFTHLYVVGLRPDADARIAVAVGLVLLALGTAIFWRSRAYYLRLEFPWRRRWEVVATVLAGSAAVFWAMFGLAFLLTSRGLEPF